MKYNFSNDFFNRLQILPSDSKFIAIKEESVENKNIAKYSVYVKPAFLKFANCPATELSISLVSESTEQTFKVEIISLRVSFGIRIEINRHVFQNLQIPIGVNVNAERYSVPSDLTEKVNQFVEDYSFKIVVTSVIALILYYFFGKLTGFDFFYTPQSSNLTLPSLFFSLFLQS